MPEIELSRSSHLIDPHLDIWGWEVAIYLFLGGMVAGVMVFSAVLALRHPADQRSPWSRWIIFAAPVMLSLGMLALLLDLEYKLHVWRFYAALKIASPMSWGSWLLLLVYPAMIFIGLATLTDSEVERLSAFGLVRKLGLSTALCRAHAWAVRNAQRISWLTLVLGIGLGVYTGILLGSLGARPAWNSAILGPLFLVSGVSTGAALLMLLPLGHHEHRLIQRWDLGAIVIEALLLQSLRKSFGVGVLVRRPHGRPLQLDAI